MRSFLFLLLLPVVAHAQDICNRYSCKPVGQPHTEATTWEGVSPPTQAAGWVCTCSGRAHLAQAGEIGAAVSADVQKAIRETMQKAVADALKEIAIEHAKRDKEIADRMAELRQENNALIKMMIELLKAQGTNTPVTPTTAKPPSK